MINSSPSLKRRNVYKVAVAYAVVAWFADFKLRTEVFPVFFEISKIGLSKRVVL